VQRETALAAKAKPLFWPDCWIDNLVGSAGEGPQARKEVVRRFVLAKTVSHTMATLTGTGEQYRVGPLTIGTSG
jgi:hypothetical protein